MKLVTRFAFVLLFVPLVASAQFRDLDAAMSNLDRGFGAGDVQAIVAGMTYIERRVLGRPVLEAWAVKKQFLKAPIGDLAGTLRWPDAGLINCACDSLGHRSIDSGAALVLGLPAREGRDDSGPLGLAIGGRAIP